MLTPFGRDCNHSLSKVCQWNFRVALYNTPGRIKDHSFSQYYFGTSWFILGSLSGWRIKLLRTECKLVRDICFCLPVPSQYWNSVACLREAGLYSSHQCFGLSKGTCFFYVYSEYSFQYNKIRNFNFRAHQSESVFSLVKTEIKAFIRKVLLGAKNSKSSQITWRNVSFTSKDGKWNQTCSGPSFLMPDRDIFRSFSIGALSKKV